MLESITLAAVVKLVVEVLIDLARSTVLDEKATENTQTTHPQNLLGHTSIGGTLPLTVATVTTLSAGKVQLTSSRTGVLGDRLADDEAIGDQFSDRLTRVGVRNFGLLVGIKPDLALAAADDGGREALLSSQIDPVSSPSAS